MIVKSFNARRHHVHQCACGTSFPDVAALSPADETTGDGADSVQEKNDSVAFPIPNNVSQTV